MRECMSGDKEDKVCMRSKIRNIGTSVGYGACKNSES